MFHVKQESIQYDDIVQCKRDYECSDAKTLKNISECFT